MKNKTFWIAETAVMIALLVALQWVTKPLGQFVTGSCVNLVLGVSTLVGGVWCGAVVALASPFCAFLVGVGPAKLLIVPFIAVGNVVLVLLLNTCVSSMQNASTITVSYTEFREWVSEGYVDKVQMDTHAYYFTVKAGSPPLVEKAEEITSQLSRDSLASS